MNDTEMTPMRSPCFDCPWNEPGSREDMIRLLDEGETLWPCHNTAFFTTDSLSGRVVNLDSQPGNRLCAGYHQFSSEREIANA